MERLSGTTVERDPRADRAVRAVRAVPTVTVRTRWGRLDVDELKAAVADGPVVALGPRCTHDSDAASRVYACVDGSARAEAILDVVGGFADGTRAGAWLLTVMTGVPHQATAVQRERLCSGYLARLSGRLEHTGVPCNWDVLHDADPARSIVSYVQDGGIVALTNHGASDRTDGLGPVATRVVRLSLHPVLLVSAPTPPRRDRPTPTPPRPVPRRTRRPVAERGRQSPKRPACPVCPECGTDAAEGTRFCGHCGHHL